MSDYLWDKSGEPEEDIERLEQLLGTLRYEPRPLKLPEDFSARAARNSFRPQQRPFRWQRLAVAASLLLTLLAGAWLIMSQHNKGVQEATKAPQQIVAPQPNEQAPQQTAIVNNANEQSAPKQKETTVIEQRVNYQPHKRVSTHVGANAKRHAPRELKTRPQEQLASTPMTPEQKQATEQLLLALRIASAKYNYAQRELQEASAMRQPESR
ncbi:MAG: hypothetical protein ACJ74W_25060 [Pyrinomonadaceae bacterium]